jgi:iron complex outermembrane receptor protein
MKYLQKSLLSRAIASALLAVTPNLIAADAADIEAAVTTSKSSQSNLVLEEVIVTARKRAEDLQETPVAITAFSAESMKIAGIANTRDLEESVPGLNFAEMAAKAPAIFIRGVGQKESTAALDPGVGVYINSIYIARTDSQLLDIMDTESIQVLRGPQGTQFGKNNTGGALLVTTQLPDSHEYGGEVSTRVGNYGRADLKATGNIPLIKDKLAARISLNTTNTDGYLKNTYNGDKYADEDRLGAKARVIWQPTDTLTVDTFYYWSKIKENGAGFTCVYQNPNGTFNTFTWPGFTEPGSFESRCNKSQEESKDSKVLINGPTKFEQTSQILGVTLDWEFDNFSIKSISAWSNQEDIKAADDTEATDITGVITHRNGVLGALERSLDAGYGDYELPGDEKRNQYSQEMQLSGSAFDDRLEYTTGIFLAREEIDDNVTGSLVGYNGYSYKADRDTLIPQISSATNSKFTNDSYGVFAQGTFDITDWYSLTVGLRYSSESRKRKASLFEADCEVIAADNLIPGADGGLCGFHVLGLADPSGFFANPPTFMPIHLVNESTTVGGEVIAADNGVVEKDQDWSKWTPTITNAFTVPDHYLEDTVFDTTLVYLTYSEGFKSGGFEMKGLEMAQFEPEDVTNYEIGVKFEAFDQRVRFNTAFYYMDYSDIQIRVADQGATFADILFFIDNAGKATIKGFETELTFLPLPNVVLTATTSYTDAQYDEFMAESIDTSASIPIKSTLDRSAEDFAGIPKLTYSFSAMALLPTAIGEFAPRLSMYYRDTLFTGLDGIAGQPEFKDVATIPDVTLWNFRLGFTPANHDNIQIWAYVDNLTDENYFQGGFSNTGPLGAGSYILGAPLTYGLEASISF